MALLVFPAQPRLAFEAGVERLAVEAANARPHYTLFAETALREEVPDPSPTYRSGPGQGRTSRRPRITDSWPIRPGAEPTEAVATTGLPVAPVRVLATDHGVATIDLDDWPPAAGATATIECLPTLIAFQFCVPSHGLSQHSLLCRGLPCCALLQTLVCLTAALKPSNPPCAQRLHICTATVIMVGAAATSAHWWGAATACIAPSLLVAGDDCSPTTRHRATEYCCMFRFCACKPSQPVLNLRSPESLQTLGTNPGILEVVLAKKVATTFIWAPRRGL